MHAAAGLALGGFGLGAASAVAWGRESKAEQVHKSSRFELRSATREQAELAKRLSLAESVIAIAEGKMN